MTTALAPVEKSVWVPLTPDRAFDLYTRQLDTWWPVATHSLSASRMNGIPKSPLNRYNQVTDVVVAHNTWINCKSPWHFGVGTNISQKDVLPPSEIRSATPIRTIVANNVIYNEKGDEQPIVAHDKIGGITFKNNLINNQNTSFEKINGIESASFEIVLRKYK